MADQYWYYPLQFPNIWPKDNDRSYSSSTTRLGILLELFFPNLDSILK